MLHLGHAEVFAGDGDAALAEEIAALASDQQELGRGGLVLFGEALCGFDQVGIECPGQPFVGGDQDQLHVLLRAARQQRIRGDTLVRSGRRCQIGQQAAQSGAVRAGGDHAILRAPQLGGRDHLHSLGDLLRVAHRFDAPADIDQARHARWPRAARRRSGP
jgi:hypothetical protein